MSHQTAVLAERVWEKEPMTALVRFILDTHHVTTREAIASLPPLATKVSGRHGEAHLETRGVEALVYRLAADLARHLQKEEQILFPYIVALDRATGYTLPADACTSFQALYSGLTQLDGDLHRHIHLENNILFPRAIELEAAGA